MPNHLHLLLRVGQKPIYDIMQSLLTSYAKGFNFRRDRWGHVFQERYQAKFCANDPYFLELLRYINLNPVRAKLAKSPMDWPWSGHAQLCEGKAGGLIDVDFPLGMFSPYRQEAIALYGKFLAEGMQPGFDAKMPELSAAQETAMVPEDIPEEANRPKAISESDWREIGCEVATANGVQLGDLLGPRRTRSISTARHILIGKLLARGIRPSHVATLLHCSAALITKASR
jgi:hypothetical protein